MKRAISIIAAVAAVLIAGCGGSGGSGGGASLSKDQVAQFLTRGFTAIQSGHGNGGGGLRPAMAKATHAAKTAPKAQASRVAALGSEEFVWFDSQFELYYVEFMEGDPGGVHDWGKHYFVDQEMTQPAGDEIWHSVWGTTPETDDQTINITAGPMTGYHIETHYTAAGDGHHTEIGTGHIPGEFDYEYTLTSTEGGLATIKEKYTYPDESWVSYENVPNDDQGGAGNVYTVKTSVGVVMSLNFGPEYDGTGTITGPSSVLPATIEWDNNGTGTVHWHDGTTTTFENWSLFS